MTPSRIELHVHFEGTVGPAALTDLARRNSVALPTPDELAALYAQRDLEHVGRLWHLITSPARLRHGISAVDHPDLLAAIAEQAIVLDVCPTSNVCLGTVASLAEHPLPRLVAAGVRCSISTDDPALFGTDLSREHEIAGSLGLSEQAAYRAAVAGALCEETTRQRLASLAQNAVSADE